MSRHARRVAPWSWPNPSVELRAEAARYSVRARAVYRAEMRSVALILGLATDASSSDCQCSARWRARRLPMRSM